MTTHPCPSAIGRTDSRFTYRPWIITALIGLALCGPLGEAVSRRALGEATLLGWGRTVRLAEDVPYRAVAAGLSYTVAIRLDGTVAAWGWNQFGQCDVPETLPTVKAIVPSYSHTVALLDDGSLAAWGSNSSGECNIPEALPEVVEVAAGTFFTAVLLHDGTVAAWGYNGDGQCNVPVGLTDVIAIRAGAYHTLALRRDGTLVAWGDNRFGQCNVAGLSGVRAISAGLLHSVALLRDGTAAAWGYNSYGQCNVPVGLTEVVGISAGAYHTLALRGDGTVVGWGDNRFGQCNVAGLTGGTTVSAYYHTVVLRADGTVVALGSNRDGECNVPRDLIGVKALSAAVSHTIALWENGTVAAWGDNQYGQCVVPTGLTDVVAVAAGAGHTAALQADGIMAVWGRNLEGQCNMPPGLSGVRAISVGFHYTLALLQDGTVAVWGDNTYGQCNVPAGLAGVTAIAAGQFHALALREDGTVVAWGGGGAMQYGQSNVPVGLTGVTAISGGQFHSIALLDDGRVLAWGDNRVGQCSVPAGLAGVTSISAGQSHSVALCQDGTVVVWGTTHFGSSEVATRLTDVTMITAGYYDIVAWFERKIPTGPDLVVVEVATPSETDLRSPLSVSWRVANAGDTTAFADVWQDTVYLSASPAWDSQATPLYTVQYTGFLAPGEHYTQPAEITLPAALVPGIYYLHVLTDSSGVIAEGRENNNTGRSNPMTVRAPYRLVFSSEPADTVAGWPMTPPVQVAVQDALGNVVTEATGTVTLSLAANPGGGTLSGATTVDVVNGVATFSDLSIDKAANGYTLRATGPGMIGTTSGGFDVFAGPATRLNFTVHPSDVTAGTLMTPAVEVKVEDAWGNTVVSPPAEVTLSLEGDPAGSLAGTTAALAVNGVASFPDLSIVLANVGYALKATADGLVPATSDPFDVVAGPPAQLSFTQSPTGAVAGMVITPEVRVSVLDAHGNLAATSAGSVTLALTGGSKLATLSGQKDVMVISGVATFSDLSIDRVGTDYVLVASCAALTPIGSPGFSVLAAGPSQLRFAVQPSGTTAGNTILPGPQVEVLDAVGNLVTSATVKITLSLAANPGGGSLSGTVAVNAVNGLATFGNLSLDKAGFGYALAATAPGVAGTTSSSFDIVPGAAARLVFRTQPGNTEAGASISPAVQVGVEDAFGNVVAEAAGAVTVNLGANPGGGTLSGARSADPIGGVATFDSLSIDRVGSGYTLAAAAEGLSGATSIAFDITPAAASRLFFRVQPSNIAAGAWITPGVEVTVVDASGNVLTSARNDITLSLVSAVDPPAPDTPLIGTATVTASRGIATFSRLSVGTVGQYRLVASAVGLAGTTSRAFEVIAGTPKTLEFTVQPAPAYINAPITPAVQVSVRDAYGNVAASSTGTIVMSIAVDPNKGKAKSTLSGTLAVSITGGTATFVDLSLDKAGVNYALGAALSGTNLKATSAPFTVGTSAP